MSRTYKDWAEKLMFALYGVNASRRSDHPLWQRSRTCTVQARSSGAMNKGIPLVCDWKVSQF